MTFYTDDMALAAYLVMAGHEVTNMRSEPRTGDREQVFWGFDREGTLDSQIVEAMNGEVQMHLYRFMGALKEVRELMHDFRRDPGLFG